MTSSRGSQTSALAHALVAARTAAELTNAELLEAIVRRFDRQALDRAGNNANRAVLWEKLSRKPITADKLSRWMRGRGAPRDYRELRLVTDALVSEASRRDPSYVAPDFETLWRRARPPVSPRTGDDTESLRRALRGWCLSVAESTHSNQRRLPYLARHPDPSAAAATPGPTVSEQTMPLTSRIQGTPPVAAPTMEGKSGSDLGPRVEIRKPHATDGQSPETISYQEACSRYRQLLLLGAPGIGKSWAIQMHAIELAEHAVEHIDNGKDLDAIALPVLIRCDVLATRTAPVSGEASASPPTLAAAAVEALTQQHADMPPALHAYLKRRLDRGTAVVYLLDALDEANPASRDAVATLIAECAMSAAARFVVTARTSSTLVFNPLSPEQAQATLTGFADPETYVRTWRLPAEREQQVLDLITEPGIEDLARIPLMLALLCNLAADLHSELPTHRTQIYSRTLRQFLRGDNRHRAADASHLPHDPVEREAMLIDVLAPLAFRLATDPGGWMDRIPSSLLRRHLAALTQSTGITASQAATMLTDETGILMRENDTRDGRDPLYLFVHRTMMEYLVAEYLATHPNLIETTVRVHLPLSEDWHEVWPLIAGIDHAGRYVLDSLTAFATSGDDALHEAMTIASTIIEDLDGEERERYRDHIDALIGYLVRVLAGAPAFDVTSILVEAYLSLSFEPDQDDGAAASEYLYRRQGRRPSGSGGGAPRPTTARGVAGDLLGQNEAELLDTLRSPDTTEQHWYQAALALALVPPEDEMTAVVGAALLRMPEVRDWWRFTGDLHAALRSSLGLRAMRSLEARLRFVQSFQDCRAEGGLAALGATLTQGEEPHQRRAAVQLLATIPGGGEVILAAKDDPAHEVRYAIARSMDSASPIQRKALVHVLLRDTHPGVRAAAAASLARRPTGLADPNLIEALTTILADDPSPSMREYGALVLGRWTIPRRAIPRVAAALVTTVASDTDLRVRLLAVEGLARIGHPQALDALIRILTITPGNEDQQTVWRTTAFLLGDTGEAGRAALVRNSTSIHAVLDSDLAAGFIYVCFTLCRGATVIGPTREPLLKLLQSITRRAESGWESHQEAAVEYLSPLSEPELGGWPFQLPSYIQEGLDREELLDTPYSAAKSPLFRPPTWHPPAAPPSHEQDYR